MDLVVRSAESAERNVGDRGHPRIALRPWRRISPALAREMPRECTELRPIGWPIAAQYSATGSLVDRRERSFVPAGMTRGRRRTRRVLPGLFRPTPQSCLLFCRMKAARSAGATRMACRTRTCGNWPSSHSRYTVAVHAPRRSATWRIVRRGSARRSGNNRVTKSSRSDGRNVVPWNPASTLVVRFDERWGDSGRVVDSPCADSEAEGHWFESSSARQLA